MGQRILIVEDERTFAEVLSEFLVDEGYSVLHVRDGITAINVLSATSPRRPDLIICDVMLPGMRGDRMAGEVRRRLPGVRLPILLMSASADPHVQLPDVSFVSKPFDTNELLSRIQRLLEVP